MRQHALIALAPLLAIACGEDPDDKAYYSAATNNTTSGYYAYKGGVVNARYSSSTGSPYAYRAGIWSYTDANSTTASGSTYDFLVEYNSFMTAASSTGSTVHTGYNDTTDWVYGK